MIRNKNIYIMLVIGILVFFEITTFAFAEEGGIGIYNPGRYDLQSGVLPKKGFYFKKSWDFYYGKIDKVINGGVLLEETEINIRFKQNEITYVTNKNIFGGDYALMLVFGTISSEISSESVLDKEAILLLDDKEDTECSIGDILFSPVVIGWHSDNLHYLINLPFYIPIGDFETADLKHHDFANIGRNRWAFDPTFAIMRENPDKTYNISAALGYILNFDENEETKYKSGDALHLDAAIARNLRNGLTIGACGYAYKQITGDSGDGAFLGDFKGRIFGAGPILGYNGKLFKKDVNIMGKWYHEFGGENHFKGDSFLIYFSIKF